MAPTRFPPEIQSELAQAMGAFARTAGAAPEHTRFVAVRDLVCRHALASSMTPEMMVVAVRDVYLSVSQKDVPVRERLRDSYERLMFGWVRAYFEEANRRVTER